MKSTVNCYCYRSGEIGFSKKVPDGTLPIFFNCTKKEKDKISAYARLAYDNKTLLIPGIPEASTDEEAYTAFRRFIHALGFPLP